MPVIECSELAGEVESNGISVTLPTRHDHLDQDEEYCLVDEGRQRRKIRFHDYDELFKIPGLYEYIIYEKLKCRSPQTVCLFLEHELRKLGLDPSQLSVLDVGAGNGIVGEYLSWMGVKRLVGIDIIKEAADAAERDRPHVYHDYFVEDLTALKPATRSKLEQANLNCLTVVAALGFGDIPTRAFGEAFNLISTPGWVAFNIRDKFLADGDSSGFSRLIDRLEKKGMLEIKVRYPYFHRLSLEGEPLEYFAIVGQKHEDIPDDMLLDE